MATINFMVILSAALFAIGVIGFCIDRGLLLARDRIVFWDKAAPRVL